MSKEIILVTGASSDIGCEIIRNIAGEKSIILAHYNNSKEKLEKLQSEINGTIIPVKANLLIENDINDLIKYIHENYEAPDKIVHLPAPKISNIRFKDIKWDDFEPEISIQLKSIVLILKNFLPLMAKRKKGKVLFMLSSYTFNIPPKALSHYITVKYALLGLMKSLASEYSDKNININAISPAMVETSFLSNLPEKIIEITAEMHPLKRNATTHDLIPLIKLLLSDESDFITGQNIAVAGGSVF